MKDEPDDAHEGHQKVVAVASAVPVAARRQRDALEHHLQHKHDGEYDGDVGQHLGWVHLVVLMLPLWIHNTHTAV